MEIFEFIGKLLWELVMLIVKVVTEQEQPKASLLNLFPAGLQPVVSSMLSIGPIIGVFALLFGLVTVIERKTLGRVQNRLGPNRVGPFGFFQFIADGVKSLIKEDLVPRTADRVVHLLAPVALVVPVLLSFAVLPFGRNMVAIDLDAGILFFFAVGAGTELAVFMAGWSGHNKYSLLGAMRAIAQMISYEIPLIISAVTVVMMVGSLSLVKIVESQGDFIGWLPKWHVFKPWGLAGLALFYIAARAESNRSPFDLPEGESEISSGYMVEYSGFKFALFFMGEYLGMFAVNCLMVTLFLGGWQAPLPFLEWVPSYIWFFFKFCGFAGLDIWLRSTLPRLRMDQLMSFAWKFLLPLTLLNIVVAALWRFTRDVQFSGALLVRWVVCFAVMYGAFVWLGSLLNGGKKLSPRTYRFAD